MNSTEYSKLNQDSEPIITTEEPQPRSSQQPEEEKKASPPNNKQHHEGGSKFECNICLDIANEPVVSPCGHLYCWACIYQWINQPKETLLCPVCKSGISAETLIPIYTKGSNEDPRKKESDEIPKRPAGQRQGPIPNQNYQGGNSFFGGNRNNTGFVMGIGLFPALFTLNFTWDDIFGSNLNDGNGSNNEDTRDKQIFKLLKVFVGFMFMCFVFFGGDVFLTF